MSPEALEIIGPKEFYLDEDIEINRKTNPSLRGSLLFIWCEKNSSEHFQEAGGTPL